MYYSENMFCFFNTFEKRPKGLYLQTNTTINKRQKSDKTDLTKPKLRDLKHETCLEKGRKALYFDEREHFETFNEPNTQNKRRLLVIIILVQFT